MIQTRKNRIDKKHVLGFFFVFFLCFSFLMPLHKSHAVGFEQYVYQYFVQRDVLIKAGVECPNIGCDILKLVSKLTYLGGELLDLSVQKVVLGMGDLIKNQDAGGLNTVIESSWKTVRDAANIVFIFGFVWIGIRTILDYGAANTKKFLASLIIAALLINFSLFFARALVDLSNILAVEIYDVLIPQIKSGEKLPDGIESGIAARFTQELGFYRQTRKLSSLK